MNTARSPFAQAMRNLNNAIRERDECAESVEQAKSDRRKGLDVDVAGWQRALDDHERTVERLDVALTLARSQHTHEVTAYVSAGYGYRCETCSLPVKSVDGLVWVHEGEEPQD